MRYIFPLLIFFAVLHCSTALGSVRSKLWKIISQKTGGSKFIPVAGNTPLNVTVEVSLLTLSDYNHLQGTVRLGVWLYMNWNASSMKWNPKAHHGLKMLIVPATEMWVPDIVPFTHTDYNVLYSGRVVVTNDGRCTWVPHIMTTIICGPTDGPRFPRDRMICRLELGSWSYDGLKMNVTATPENNVDLANFDSVPLLSSGWEFFNTSFKRKTTYFPCCTEPYLSLETDIIIQRRDVYFGMAVSAPGVVTGLLVSLLYLVPPPSSARIVSQVICLFILVFVAVTELRIMGSSVLLAPAAYYFITAMVFNFFAILWSVMMRVLWLKTHTEVEIYPGIDRLDWLLIKFERICCLPSTVVETEIQEVKLDEEENTYTRRGGITKLQRLCLLLDRFMCLINIFIFIILFILLSA